MTVRNLAPDGDIVTSGTQFITGIDEVAQTILTRLRLFLGEYFRNIDEGMPWYQRIFPNTTNLSIKEEEIKRMIVQTPNVGGLTAFSQTYDFDTRRLNVTATVVSNAGREVTIQLNEVF